MEALEGMAVMKIRQTTDADLAYWAEWAPQLATMTPPDGMDDCEPCAAIITHTDDGSTVVRVPWVPDEIELSHLARGGTLWLSTWGGLPPHLIEVAEPGAGT